MFLLRSTHAAAANQSSEPPSPVSASAAVTATPSSQASKDLNSQSKQAITLEGLIAEDGFSFANEDQNGEAGGCIENGNIDTPIFVKDHTPIPNRHVDVTEDEGWITIPQRELPSSWNEAPDIQTFRSLDRSFVFPGEQVHILACLSASKQDTEIVTPFKVAAVMSKNGAGKNGKKQNGLMDKDKTLSENVQVDSDDHGDSEDVRLLTEKNDTQMDISSGESLARMEDHRKKMQNMLQRLKESYFFVRISGSDEFLWSKRCTTDTSDAVSVTSEAEGAGNVKNNANSVNAMIDKGRSDARVTGGVARNSITSCSLSNGDIVVLLQVNVGVDFLKDPTLEILQYEKFKDGNSTSEIQGASVISPEHGSDQSTCTKNDPFGELLHWLLPLENSHPPLTRPLSPPLANVSHKASFSPSTSSQIFSFGNFRSYSMSSLSVPPTAAPSPPSLSSASSKPSIDLEDWDRLSQKLVKIQKTGNEGLLSFRGVPLESERFSARCGLEGIYVPGRRWRKPLEIVQPIDIRTFAANCNTDDLLCVQIKNVSPAHIPDIIVDIDAITIISEEAFNGDPQLSIPVTCIEAGTDYSLPNISLRRGEEHSFILKPATSILKSPILYNDKTSQLPRLKSGKPPTIVPLPRKTTEGWKSESTSNEYSVLVSCRCNYTESKLFFKKHTTWRPRISRDVMLSVANLESDSRVSQLPVQVLTLQASNRTMEDLTLTILAPASMTSHPSVVSLMSPSTPMTPSVGFSTTHRLSSMPLLVENDKNDDSDSVQSLSFDNHTVPISDFIPTTALACNHLWLQSRVQLGRVPSQSTATVKLQLLPLTDGIITLDTLKISVKEKGAIYVPEESLKINATSSIATGII